MTDSIFENKNVEKEPVRVALDDTQYPDRVKDIMGNKAPEHLDMLGNIALLDTNSLGFCGSRKASLKGMETVRDCAEQAARNNVSVVSGNAAGIDFEAHFHCLKAGGNTILVLPEGINHFRIKKDLKPVWDWDRVLVISQFEPDEPWKVYRAMARSKLTIALSRAMIVIEAGEKGGTLNAGEETLKSHIPLYVAQYQDMSVDARGNQLLLDKGAHELLKSRSANKANLTKVFANMGDGKPLERLSPQGDLL